MRRLNDDFDHAFFNWIARRCANHVVGIGLMICGARAVGAESLPPDQFDRSLRRWLRPRIPKSPSGFLPRRLLKPGPEKWTVVEHDIAADIKTVTLCRSDRARWPICGGPAFSLDYR